MFKYIALALSVFAVLATCAQAEILIDFNDSATNPSSGGTWNTFGALPITAYGLVDSSGTATSVTMVFTVPAADSISTDDGWSDASIPWVVQDATRDFFWFDSSHGTVTLEFDGLDDNKTYVVELVASRNTTSDVACNYQVQGNYTTNSEGFDCYADGYLGHEVMAWESVAPTGGKITLTAGLATGNTYGYLNALRLEEVPEPSTFVLLGLAAVSGGLFWQRRRCC